MQDEIEPMQAEIEHQNAHPSWREGSVGKMGGREVGGGGPEWGT